MDKDNEGKIGVDSRDNGGFSINESIGYVYEDIFKSEDLERRHLYINGNIDNGVIDDVVYHILRYNRIDKGIAAHDRRPIILYINSPGGDLVSGYSLIDAILLSKTPVYTVNIGECASMAFLVFIAGDFRFTMPHSQFLMHDGTVAGNDSTAKMKDRMEFEFSQLEEMVKEYVVERTLIDADAYEQKYRCEWYFLPKEAKQLGVADYILGQNGCNIDEII